MTRLVWSDYGETIYMPGEEYEPRHLRADWTETDERLDLWYEEEFGSSLFTPGSKHRKEE